MKYKKLTKEQIIISLDRLTRFKNTKEKYLRVFSDILISNLIEPKYRKSDIEQMDFALISDYVSVIFNNSLDYRRAGNNINMILKEYENSIFNNDEETQFLLNNNIDYISAIDMIPKGCCVNLKWLKSLRNFDIYNKLELTQKRVSQELKYPIEKVILVEGITEEILLPAFSRHLGYDFYALGIQIIPAGGKNQVVKLYYKLAESLKIPIFILLDKDAEDNINQIKPRLRAQDKIHLVSCGEFEDLLPKHLIINTVNKHFKNFLKITEADLELDLSMAKILEEIFKTKGLHEFKKSEFAKLVREEILTGEDISEEIIEIINEIFLNKKT